MFAENGTRILKMDDTFFTGYRTNILRPDEVIIDLLVPFTEKVRGPVAGVSTVNVTRSFSVGRFETSRGKYEGQQKIPFRTTHNWNKNFF